MNSIKTLNLRTIVIISSSVVILSLAITSLLYFEEYQSYQKAKEAVSKIYNGHYDDKNGEEEFEEYKLFTNGIMHDLETNAFLHRSSGYHQYKDERLKKRHQKRAISLLEEASRKGHAKATVTLSEFYHWGHIADGYGYLDIKTTPDQTKSNHYYSMAIKAGKTPMVKVYYGAGRYGSPASPYEALKYFRGMYEFKGPKAAIPGSSTAWLLRHYAGEKKYGKDNFSPEIAAHFVGKILDDGGFNGLVPNRSDALEWYLKSPKHSAKEIGLLHLKGLGVVKDETTAYAWFLISAREGEDEDIKLRDDLEKKLPESERFKGREIAKQLVKKYDL